MEEDTQDTCADDIMELLLITAYTNLLTLETLGVSNETTKNLKSKLEAKINDIQS